jgi:predicted O-methyltransferase YrrM
MTTPTDLSASGSDYGTAVPLSAQSLGYADAFVAEDAATATARQRAEEVGAEPVPPAVGASLRLLATLIGARHVVELGTGTGVSALWLLRGMAPDGVLTTIEVEPAHQRLARRAFTEAGYPATRVRPILGQALEVLPRLNADAYDLVLIDSARLDYQRYVTQALRLLRVGGLLVVHHALLGDRVADPTARDAETVAVREAGRAVAALDVDVDTHGSLGPVLLPVGDGLIVALKAS